MSDLKKELKDLLLKFPFFRDLKRRQFYFRKLNNLKEADVKGLVKILKDVLKEWDKKAKEVKMNWDRFIAQEEKKMLDLIKKKLEEKERRKIKQIRERLK